MSEERMEEEIVHEDPSNSEVENVETAGADLDLIDQVKDAEGRALRAQAELENFRVRVRRDMEDQLKFASQRLLTDLLPVIDNIYRAVSAASQDQQSDGLLEGVSMVAQQILETLEQHHCRKMEAVGQPFDPNLHEAISQMPSDEYEQGDVMQVVQDGYLLHDRVIRPAHVIISTGRSGSGQHEASRD